MKLVTSSIVVTLALGAGVAAQPKKGPKVISLDDVTDCTYFDQQIRKMEECIRVNRGHEADSNVTLTEGHCAAADCKSSEVGKTVRANQAGPYGRAAAACEAAKSKYFVEKGKCEVRNRKQMGATAGTGGPKTAEQLQALNELTKLVNAFGRNQTQQGISAIEQAVNKLARTGYTGAGVQIEGDDPLASLGLAFLDVSALDNTEANWGTGAWYGRSWEHTADLEGVKTKRAYCDAWLTADRKTCYGKCGYYFGPGKDTSTGRHLQRVFENCGGKAGCERWCIADAKRSHRSCMNSDTLVVDSAGQHSLMDSQGAGLYSQPASCNPF